MAISLLRAHALPAYTCAWPVEFVMQCYRVSESAISRVLPSVVSHHVKHALSGFRDRSCVQSSFLCLAFRALPRFHASHQCRRSFNKTLFRALSYIKPTHPASLRSHPKNHHAQFLSSYYSSQSPSQSQPAPPTSPPTKICQNATCRHTAVVITDPYNDFLHPQAASHVFEEGSWGAEFFAGLEPRPENGDVVVSKHWNSSSFQSTDLDVQLHQRDITNLVFCGLTANTCMEATARYAYELGYHVTMMTDATAGFTKEATDAATDLVWPLWAHRVMTVGDYLATFKDAK